MEPGRNVLQAIADPTRRDYQQNRERYCKAKPEELNEVAVWVNHYQQFWTEQFNAPGNY